MTALLLLGIIWSVSALVMAVVWAISMRVNNVGYVDVAWAGRVSATGFGARMN